MLLFERGEFQAQGILKVKDPEVGTQHVGGTVRRQYTWNGLNKEPDPKGAYELRLEVTIVFYMWWETTGVFWIGKWYDLNYILKYLYGFCMMNT